MHRVTEHEQCAADLSELRWHIAYHTRNLNIVRSKHEAASKLNNEYKAELADISSRMYVLLYWLQCLHLYCQVVLSLF